MEIGDERPVYRILMVTGIYPTARKPHAGTFIQPLVEALRARGHVVDVLHPGPGPAPLRYFQAMLQVFWYTLGGRYDIVHGHYGLWCLVARLQWRAAVVAAFLGDDLLGTITASGRYSRKSRLVVFVSRWLCRVVDAATVKSEQMKQAAGCDGVVVIPDGVDLTRFYPCAREEARTILGWESEHFIVLFANNPAIPVKNVALAQAAVQQLVEKGMQVSLVCIHGQSQERVRLAMNASNALILPSLAEGAPNVVKEALACNLLVVATNVGDVAQVIGQTAGCCVCRPAVDELAAGLTTALLYTGPASGRRDVAHLAHTVIVERVLELYGQALCKHRGRRKTRFLAETDRVMR